MPGSALVTAARLEETPSIIPGTTTHVAITEPKGKPVPTQRGVCVCAQWHKVSAGVCSMLVPLRFAHDAVHMHQAMEQYYFTAARKKLKFALT